MKIESYKADFIKFLVHSGVLTFGDFVTKSGRKTPYFINMGQVSTGKLLAEVGRCYARHVQEIFGDEVTVLFGPAYKGIPLATATAVAMASHQHRDVAVSFNRKQAKNRGERGIFLCKPIEPGDKVVIVEDVITAGTTFREVVPLIRDTYGGTLLGAVLAVDRQERGSAGASAVKEVAADLNFPIHPIVQVDEIVAFLSKENDSGRILTEAELEAIRGYLKEYGPE